MIVVRHLVDWCWQWICMLAVLIVCGTAQADVILWESKMASGTVSFTAIAGGQIRSQAIDLVVPATARMISLNAFAPSWYWWTGGPAQISLWLDSTPAERKTLIYSGAFTNSWSGLAVAMPAGRSFLSLENLAGSQTIAWNQEVENGVPTRFHGRIEGTPVPEPEMVVLLVVCGLTGIFCAWRSSRGKVVAKKPRQ